MPYFTINTCEKANINLVSLFNIILFSTLYFKNTSFIQICAISSTKISFMQAMKYPYLMNLSIIINMLLYSCPVIGSFNFSNFTIKSYNMTSYGLLTNLTSYNNLYSLYLFFFFFFLAIQTLFSNLFSYSLDSLNNIFLLKS